MDFLQILHFISHSRYHVLIYSTFRWWNLTTTLPPFVSGKKWMFYVKKWWWWTSERRWFSRDLSGWDDNRKVARKISKLSAIWWNAKVIACSLAEFSLSSICSREFSPKMTCLRWNIANWLKSTFSSQHEWLTWISGKFILAKY